MGTFDPRPASHQAFSVNDEEPSVDFSSDRLHFLQSSFILWPPSIQETPASKQTRSPRNNAHRLHPWNLQPKPTTFENPREQLRPELGIDDQPGACQRRSARCQAIHLPPGAWHKDVVYCGQSKTKNLRPKQGKAKMDSYLHKVTCKCSKLTSSGQVNQSWQRSKIMNARLT